MRQKKIQIDADKTDPKRVTITQKGCSFCDVSKDKGFMGTLGDTAVKSQMACLPEQVDGSRVAFELINENPLPRLDRIMELADE